MTEQEAYAMGWHASQRDLKNEDVLVAGPDGPIKAAWTIIDNDAPAEILEDENLLAAWRRGFDEGCRANFDRAFPPD
jgi:hypothetical protein